MSGAIVLEAFKNAKKDEYIRFAEHLGAEVRFSEDKWICENMRRSPAETPPDLTLYFHRIPERHRDTVKYFSVILLIQGKSIRTVKMYTSNLTKFFDFWITLHKTAGLHICDEFIAAEFYQYLKECGLAEITNTGIWSSVCVFFKTMNGWDDATLKNPFSLSPYSKQRKFDYKYIPENVALQLDHVFQKDEIALHLRCAYWLLRLIPSRVSEIVGIKTDCLKRYSGNYVLFIPTWKQNGGRREPIMRSIHLEDTGIAEYLINLVKEQQDAARQLQEYMPDHKKGALLTYRQRFERNGQLPYHTKQYRVSNKDSIQWAFRDICAKYRITDTDGRLYELTTHQFRHNGITDRLAAGFTAAQIAEMTGHHGSAMIYNSYAHLNLLPEKIIEKQEYVSNEVGSRENGYVMFGGRILNMEEQLEKRLLRNLRAHKVRGGICSDITGCKSDMWDCLDCRFFVPDADQLEYYKEQTLLWREKRDRFAAFPIIKGNAEKNAELFERILTKIDGGLQLP
jgi:site-specific recombinase XerD